jgi:hypothetical protein
MIIAIAVTIAVLSLGALLAAIWSQLDVMKPYEHLRDQDDIPTRVQPYREIQRELSKAFGTSASRGIDWGTYKPKNRYL